jgi:hypothetical protein
MKGQVEIDRGAEILPEGAAAAPAAYLVDRDDMPPSRGATVDALRAVRRLPG